VFQFFRFRKGRSYDAPGAGANGLGLLKPQTDPMADGFNVPGYAIMRSFAPQSIAYVKDAQQFAEVDLIGNGIASQGQLELQRLAQLTNGG
jgi:hypothetical protein